MNRVRMITMALLLLAVTSGCADFRYRYEQGLKWHLENEAAKNELDRNGFPQYTGDF